MRTLALLAPALLAGGCVGGANAASAPTISEAGAHETAENVAEAAENAVEEMQLAMEAADEVAAVAEAQAFMEGYARDLLAGDRAAIAARYDRRGAWRVGNGEKSFETWTAIRDFYAGPNWSPPASFAWRELEYQPIGRDAVVVVGLFDWGAVAGRPPVTVSYTGLLVRQGGALRIRLEDESR
jgi:hypothetical protein